MKWFKRRFSGFFVFIRYYFLFCECKYFNKRKNTQTISGQIITNIIINFDICTYI